MLRLLSRRHLPPAPDRIRLNDAIALFWEGSFERAMARAGALVADAHRPWSRASAVRLQILCLVFSGRAAEGRKLFDAHERLVRSITWGRELGIDGKSLEAILLFHEGAHLESRARLEKARRSRRVLGPPARILLYHLGAIAHAQGHTDLALHYLIGAIRGGGDLFIAGWAVDTFLELAPVLPASLRQGPPPPASGWRALAFDLRAGLRYLALRGRGRGRAQYGYDRIAILITVDLVCLALLRSFEYSRGATLWASGAMAVAAPLALFVVTAFAAASAMRRQSSAPSLAGAFYSALPTLLVLDAVANGLSSHGHATLGPLVQVIAAIWSLAVFVVLLRRLSPGAGSLRWMAALAIFGATWIAPMYWTSSTPVWLGPFTGDDENDGDIAGNQQEQDRFLYAQADAVHAAETAILADRPGIRDLYFVGFAGYGGQDVFSSEVRYAQHLFDQRFDTRGRSIVLANDLSTRGSLPMATKLNLGHVLKAIGSRMDRDEDILFLLLTSHGSQAGLALDYPGRPWRAGDQTLAPGELRVALDEAGIRWRVLMVAGCEAGVFVPALRNDETLIATAASSDRSSFGCSNGNELTEFGRAVLAEQLVHERSFPVAFQKATAVIAQREADRHLVPSLPQLFVGPAIAEKLRSLEARLDAADAASDP
jgi:hypothetical protein